MNDELYKEMESIQERRKRLNRIRGVSIPNYSRLSKNQKKALRKKIRNKKHEPISR